jgi:predicted PurR-regulated permease PerM
MQANRHVTVNITNKTILRSILWVVASILAFHFVGRIAYALTLIFISFFLALAINPMVQWIGKRLKIKSRSGSTLIAYVFLISVLVGFFILVSPPLVKQTRQFISDVPQTISNFQSQDNGIAKSLRKYHLDDKITTAAKDFASNYSNFGNTILDTGKRIISVFVALLVVIVMTFMMLVEGPKWMEAYWRLVPAARRKHDQAIAARMYKAVTGFVYGQVILALLAGTFSFVALEVASRALNVSINPPALAGIVAMLGLIPMIGNTISSTIVSLVCLLTSAKLAIIMLIYFFIYYHIESYTFQPYIQSRLNELTPLLVFASAIIGVEFAGLLGALIAIPAATVTKILVEDQISRRGLVKADDVKY